MGIAILLIVHWYLGFLVQSVFLHRYAAHKNFEMSLLWEKIFYFFTFLILGSSYMSAYAFGAMHKIHHAHADKELDPHSPLKSPGYFGTLLQARNSYFNIFIGKTRVEPFILKGLPAWHSFDKFAHSWITRSVWVLLYIYLYITLATAWWMFLFLPITIGLGALQGALINWWAHSFGYRNFITNDNSNNLIALDVLFLGESYHNNHHKHPWKLNHAYKWFEFDIGYYFIRFLSLIGVVRIKKRALA